MSNRGAPAAGRYHAAVAGLTNKALAGVFKEIEILMQVLGEPRGRAIAYGRISRILETLGPSAADLAAHGQLTKIKGLGEKVQKAIQEIVVTGDCEVHAQLVARLPAGTRDVLRVPGLGPRRVHTVLKELGVHTLDGLEEAAGDGRLAALKGFGQKTAGKVREGIAFLRTLHGRARLHDAWAAAQAVIERLGLKDAVIAGDLRRGEPTVSGISIVAAGEPALIEEPATETSPSVRVRLERSDKFARALFEETGPADHVAAVLAKTGTDGDELEIYRSRGLSFVPPERRHACDGSEAVPRLIERADLKGLVHAHTTWSDGTASIEEMAAAAGERGFSYLVVTDHSPLAVYANGLSVERLLEQGAAIRAFNERGGPVRVLCGTEVDILHDGAIDYPDEVLAELDLVIASIHSVHDQDEETMTARIVRAVNDPHVDVLGHLTGQLRLRREPSAVDVERVLGACAASNTLVELNASPWRLDLDPAWHARAVELGIGVPINPDAHSCEGMDDVHWGVLAARHGGLRAEDVPNTGSWEEFLR